MKKLKKVLLFAVIAIILVVVAVSYITLALPNVGPAEDIKVDLTPQRIARGEYLAKHVTLCVDCHSKRDWSQPDGFAAPEHFGSGGELFDTSVGFPGSITVPNITPYKLHDWTDGEIFRAITTGVRKNGKAIFPLMPWPSYSKMSREDVYAIIAYLRTFKPIKADYAESTLNFPLNIIVHTMPQKASLVEMPAQRDTMKYAAYIINAAGCIVCHSQEENGKIPAGMEFAGGREFKANGKIFISSNITPDKNTGIGSLTEETFMSLFKAHADSVKKLTFKKSVMPWYYYGGMKDADLKAIYTYLRTVKPVNHKVANGI